VVLTYHTGIGSEISEELLLSTIFSLGCFEKRG